MKNVAIALLSLGLGCLSWGSDPGEPLSTEDWVLVLPGLSVEVVLPWGSCEELDDVFTCPELGSQHMGLASADGSAYYTTRAGTVCEVPDVGKCWRHEIRRFTSTGQTDTVAYIEDRIGSPTNTIDAAYPRSLSVDGTNGFLYVTWKPFCLDRDSGDPDCINYPSNLIEIIRIRGLPTLYEILQTYTPSSGPISFRVPYMPEGMGAVDWFDTYWGDLATVGDWSQAQPLQCEYPATPPEVGDYLTVTDTLPIPSPGAGYYYITAATYLGDTKYGRQGNQGVLSGRDPSLLPECTVSE